MSDVIYISPNSKRNQVTLMALGGLLVFAVIAFIPNYWAVGHLVLSFLLSVGLILLFIGILKYLEPPTSYELTRNKLKYQHKYGGFEINWGDIQRLAQVKEQTFWQEDKLPFIGVNLKDRDHFLATLSPRLASRLIHEQRPLTSYAVRHQLIKFEQGIINFEPYKYGNKLIKGPIAAFCYHAEALREAFGYDIFLPITSFDRDLDEFMTLLESCIKHQQDNQ